MTDIAGRRQMGRGEVRLSRREIRESCSWGDTQLKVHLARLVDLELVVAHKQDRGFVYELAWDGSGRDGRPFLCGLIDPAGLGYDGDRSAPSGHRSAPNGERSGVGRPLVGPRSGGGRPGPTTVNGQLNAHNGVPFSGDRENHSSRVERA